MIWICIPVHNNISFTIGCLDSINKQTYTNYKIIVCDDGSTDSTSEFIKNKFPNVKLLKGDGNLWWAGAINKCLQYVIDNGKDADYVLLLNNDLKLKEDYLQNIINYAKPNEMIGSIAVDINNEKNVVYAGEYLGKFSASSLMIHRKFNKYNKLNEWETDLLTGRGTLFPKSLINKIGFMQNSSMPQYGADVEYSVRAKKGGLKLKIYKNVKVYSYVDNTGKASVYKKSNIKDFVTSFFTLRSPNYYKSRYYFAKAYTPAFWLPVFLSIQFLRITAGFIKRNFLRLS